MHGPFWYRMRGESMAPALHDGDEVRLEPLDGLPRPGDVVVARGGSGWIIHRVTRVAGGMVTTRGDACVQADPPLPRARVLLRATHRRRHDVVQPVPHGRVRARVWLRRVWAGVASALGRARWPGTDVARHTPGALERQGEVIR